VSSRVAISVCLLILLGVQPYCHAQSSPDEHVSPSIDEVLVTGERPGPGMVAHLQERSRSLDFGDAAATAQKHDLEIGSSGAADRQFADGAISPRH
jgi:hypothetical protein